MNNIGVTIDQKVCMYHHCFVYQDGKMTDPTELFNGTRGFSPNGGVQLVGINDAGQIVVNDAQDHAYLLTPLAVPEPPALALLGAASLGLLARRLRGGVGRPAAPR